MVGEEAVGGRAALAVLPRVVVGWRRGGVFGVRVVGGGWS